MSIFVLINVLILIYYLIPPSVTIMHIIHVPGEPNFFRPVILISAKTTQCQAPGYLHKVTLVLFSHKFGICWNKNSAESRQTGFFSFFFYIDELDARAVSRFLEINLKSAFQFLTEPFVDFAVIALKEINLSRSSIFRLK